MSNNTKIYPMAFLPNKETLCNLYYVGFPKAWKEKLIKTEKIIKPRWDKTYALPTYALKNSLGVWLDGIIELTPLRLESNDEMWAVSCGQEIDTNLLFEHIKIWLHSYYLDNPKLCYSAKTEIKELISNMNIEELNKLKGNKEIKLFDENGIPTENNAYSAFTLRVTNALVGKSIEIDGRAVVFYYAGKNQLISEIQGEGDKAYSYGISFSLQTVPPERKPLLLCNCCIHKWIPGKWKEKPYLNQENIIAHIWAENHRIYRLPIYQKYKSEEEYFWQEAEKKYYNLYCLKSLPAAREVVDSFNTYLQEDRKITCLYRKGMDKLGFQKNKIGTGVSMKEKNDIHNGILSYLSKMVYEIEGVKRIKPTKNARRKLKVDEINFNHKLTEQQKVFVAKRMKECTESNQVNFEVYYKDDCIECAEEIMEKLQNIFQSSEDIIFDIKMCKLGKMGEALEDGGKGAIIKRIKEIDRELDIAAKVTACIVLLPGKDKFMQNDPKDAIRCGFALKNRLTQFIVPWDREEIDCSNVLEEIKNDEETKKNEEKNEKTISTIVSAIEDLCRQLGYVRAFDSKVIDNTEALAHTTVIGMYVITQVNTLYGKAKYLPFCVELDYVSGKVFVECDAFQQIRVSYREAQLELARLSLDKDFEKKCDSASKSILKQKMIMWKHIYKNKNLLVLIEANGNTRSLCYGITDSEIQKYNYLEPYCPEEIEVGTKEKSYRLNLNNSKVRFVRIRQNGEVPDYYTDLSQKKGYSATSGVFQYQKDYWSVASRPNNKDYNASLKETRYTKPYQDFKKRHMIEIYPIQLQKGDNPDEWVIFTESLREGAIQYDEATNLPLPLHMAEKLQEYILMI